MLFSQLSLAQLLSHVQLFVTPWTPAPQASLSCPLSHWCHPTITSSVVSVSSHLQSSPVSGFCKWVGSLYQVTKVLEFHLTISLSNEYSGLTSFRMDELDLLTVQETLKSLHKHISKASILQRSAFFTVQLSHPYMTTRKNHSLD